MWGKYGNYAVLSYMLVYECPSILIFSFKLSLFLQDIIWIQTSIIVWCISYVL